MVQFSILLGLHIVLNDFHLKSTSFQAFRCFWKPRGEEVWSNSECWRFSSKTPVNTNFLRARSTVTVYPDHVIGHLARSKLWALRRYSINWFLILYFFWIQTRETREGWPLLTVETEVNGDSKSTNQKEPSLIGLGLSCRYKRFLFSLGCLKYFFLAVHFFNSLPQSPS